MADSDNNYNINVFINCPFDAEYKPLFDAAIFTIKIAGFIPRAALEASNAADNRIDKILKIISECKYGIHDLSRTEFGSNNLPRFNMPFELGLDFACKKFGAGLQRQKRLLIMDKNPNRYVKFISDIRGQDVEGHNKSIKKIIENIRNWLSTESRRDNIPGGRYIYSSYKNFLSNLPTLCHELNIRVEELTFNNRSYIIGLWLQETEE